MYEFEYEYDFIETFKFDYEYEFDYEYNFLETFRLDFEYDVLALEVVMFLLGDLQRFRSQTESRPQDFSSTTILRTSIKKMVEPKNGTRTCTPTRELVINLKVAIVVQTQYPSRGF